MDLGNLKDKAMDVKDTIVEKAGAVNEKIKESGMGDKVKDFTANALHKGSDALDNLADKLKK